MYLTFEIQPLFTLDTYLTINSLIVNYLKISKIMAGRTKLPPGSMLQTLTLNHI